MKPEVLLDYRLHFDKWSIEEVNEFCKASYKQCRISFEVKYNKKMLQKYQAACSILSK